jgi:SNF2 family DNA or RNA helicase
MRNRQPNDLIPQGVIFDESSRLKSPTAQRSKAAQDLADMIRDQYSFDGFTILMSGTPSPKSPLDWWKQCEIAWPGFLREGSQKALKERLAFLVKEQYDDTVVKALKGWRDDKDKCDVCGDYEDEGSHSPIDVDDEWGELARADDWHEFEPSFNEVAFMYKRLDGLVHVLHKKDVLDLPDKIYEEDVCEPNASTLRAAQALMEAAPNAITGMTWLREVSDGFMYKDEQSGKKTCNICKGSERNGEVREWFDPSDSEQGFEAIDFLDDEFVKRLQTRWVECRQCHGTQQMVKYKRITKEIPCPKEEKLKTRLEQCEESGRIVIFAGFQGSLDRIQRLCHKQHWDVVRCDGRGWHVTTRENQVVKTDEPLKYWKNHNQVGCRST